MTISPCFARVTSSGMIVTPCHKPATASRRPPSLTMVCCLVDATAGTCGRHPDATRDRHQPVDRRLLRLVAAVDAAGVRIRRGAHQDLDGFRGRRVPAIDAGESKLADVRRERVDRRLCPFAPDTICTSSDSDSASFKA